ncbi:MAG: PRC-barrel domain-containing protein [Rhodospirillales bacterium]|nr:PRC-barrel domain-containing protein [Rhodospirillales bacterium]
MLKPVVFAAILTCGAVAAYAQPAPKPAPPPAPTERTVSTGDFNVSGDMSASALLGTRVRNANKETIGKVDDIYIDKDAAIKVVVISVGGFLGVGSKDVAVKWSDLTFSRDDTSVALTTSLTKDALMALPDYTRAERRQVVPAETATAPPARPAPATPPNRQ